MKTDAPAPLRMKYDVGMATNFIVELNTDFHTPILPEKGQRLNTSWVILGKMPVLGDGKRFLCVLRGLHSVELCGESSVHASCGKKF